MQYACGMVGWTGRQARPMNNKNGNKKKTNKIEKNLTKTVGGERLSNGCLSVSTQSYIDAIGIDGHVVLAAT